MSDKIKVSTTGDFMMQDPTTGEEIQAYGESEVTRSAWVEQQIVEGKLDSPTKPKEEDLANPGSDAEPVRAKAEQGEKRGASKSKDPATINSVKSA